MGIGKRIELHSTDKKDSVAAAIGSNYNSMVGIREPSEVNATNSNRLASKVVTVDDTYDIANNMADLLEEELKHFQEYADNGKIMAQESFATMKNSLEEVKKELESIERQQNEIERIKNDSQVNKQLQEIKEFERTVLNEVAMNLTALSSRMSDFSIVLYGRTMAGKSTLMEVLTHGDGTSIGMGAQRTTLDVRDYNWHGLRIYDVPGTCSFGGKEDDKTAFEAAKSADMALFLLTDDSPQPEEAERLEELIKLGKPVLGIVNVKQNLNAESIGAKRKIELKGIEKKIKDEARLKDIVTQFKAFAARRGYNFNDIHFVNSHLKAAYLSQPERENNPSLYALSNFAAVEKFIIDKVRQDGKFIRIKTFVDSVALPMQCSICKLYEHSGQMVNIFWSFDDKITELRKWRESFWESVKRRYGNFYDSLSNQIAACVERIVNEHYESSNAGEAWGECVERLNINSQCQEFISKIGAEATKKMRELSDELTQDLRYSGTAIELPRISMDEITDYQSGLLIAAPLLAFTPVGWVGAAVVGIGSLLFGDSKSEKIAKQKQELRERLQESVSEILSNLDDRMVDILNNEIFDKQINGFEHALFSMRDMRMNLSYTQNRIADTINSSYRDLNLRLLSEAIDYVGGKSDDLTGVLTARIVGKMQLVFSTSGMNDLHINKVNKLLQEVVMHKKCNDANYFDGVIEFLEKNILHCELHVNGFIDEDWGKMYTLSFERKFVPNSEEIQLAQQVFDSPAR